MRLFIWVTLLVLCACTGELEQTLACLRDYVKSLEAKMSPRLFRIFAKSFPNTMSTTISHYELLPGKEATYIITGDIEAMWLRDSTNQFLPYIRMQKECPHVRSLSKGLLNTQAEFINVDPYSNAFRKYELNIAQRPFYLNDKSEILVFGVPVDQCGFRSFNTPLIWERKFEIDSLASFLRLAVQYKRRFLDLAFLSLSFFKALRRILSLLEEQTKDTLHQREGKPYYSFIRNPTELEKGQIKPASGIGLIKTGFRPSDDPCTLPYNIPGNAMIATYLAALAKEVLAKVPIGSVYQDLSLYLSARFSRIGDELRQNIYRYGLHYKNGKTIFAYEVDGTGKSQLYDDSNLPSLLSLPYLQFIPATDALYVATREYLLSPQNIFYFGSKLKGIGSSHTPGGYIWPLALITQIMTSRSEAQIRNCLVSLVASAKNDLIHEAFDANNPQVVTREWFAWANSFFGEMIAALVNRFPRLLLEVK